MKMHMGEVSMIHYSKMEGNVDIGKKFFATNSQ
jgi:hypothetical protein